MRKPLTEAQLAASAERKARLRAICQKIADMPEAERAALAARTNPITVEGRTLSLHNACMIAMQNPAATVLGGFHQWKTAGRQVKKGEHGIGIWVPRFEGKEAESAGEVAGFLFGTVFDVSQTEPASVAVEA
jgi:hypothetical protein